MVRTRQKRYGKKSHPLLEAWQLRHPLRRWLDHGKFSKRQIVARYDAICAACDCSRFAVYAWLRGLNRPNAWRFAALERLTGVTKRQWSYWENIRPSILRPKGD